MRRLLAFALFACALSVQAEGTLRFNATLTAANEVPPNGDPTIASATFTLNGNVLDFYVYVPAETFLTTGGAINGPALAGSNASLIFDLGGFVFHTGSSLGDPPFYSSGSPAIGPFGAGPFMLNDNQINELMSGLWYVNIGSYDHPEGQLRGQIVPVPEPSAMALLGLGLGTLTWRYWRQRASDHHLH